jgi:uncharacterized heparinase superfamily protein
MLRYLATLKYLKISQIYYLLFFRLFKYLSILNIKLIFFYFSINKNKNFSYILKYKNDFDLKIASNIKKTYKKKINWKLNKNKLYLYNLHYLNFIFLFSKKDSINIINSWIDNNKISYHSVAWDIYPSSHRLINLIKWSYKNNYYSSKLSNTIYLHAKYILKNFEYHLGGNHLLTNFKSIIFAFSYFKDSFDLEIIKRIKKKFLEELNYQILKDGGHFENSPMYHNQIIFDLLDIIQINELDKVQNKYLINIIHKMLHWSETVSHNGEVAYFNDSCINIQPNYRDLLKYVKKLKIKKQSKRNSKKSLYHFKNSGFIIFKNNQYKLIFRSGGISSNSIPAHQHANSLSFEISNKKGKIFTNSGVSTYNNNHTRHYERGTMSQNTISINKLNSMDVWKSFRVGSRPNVISKITLVNNKEAIFFAEHNGFFQCKRDNILHKRKIHCTQNNIKIQDFVNGNNKAKIYFNLYLHNNILIKKFKNYLELSSKFFNSKIILNSDQNILKISNSSIANNFFSIKKNKKIYFIANLKSIFTNSINLKFKK